jgi:histidine kinase/DNA gyrase B/HSP90-like ATPase
MKKFKPRIGKNVIETLTLGMYEDARFIYREYVQNAADQIDVAVEEKILNHKDEGEINITIDKENKKIIIEDNATGIKDENVLQFLGDVANSQKDKDKRKGFRGIGRLGGLGYCEKLIFETSYKGENTKNTITLNAKQLKKILENKADTSDAATVISVITSLDKTEAEIEDHFFKVELQNVTNEELLDEDNIRNYLSMVAPIPFSKEFPFWKKIHTHFNKNNVKIDEYDVHLNINEEKLYKAYKTDIFNKNNEPVSKILRVNFFKITNEEDELIALLWYGVSDLLNFQIPNNNIERGFRLRKDNIGIGSEITLSRFFGETRQNLNYVGEIHAISTSFIPNARRDYFNDNKTCQIFEQKLRKFFSTLGTLTTKSSKLHNRKKDILEYKEELNKFQKKVRGGKLTQREEIYFKNKLKKLKNTATSSKNEIDKIQNKTIDDENLKIIYESIIGDVDINVDSGENIEVNKTKNYPITLSQLNETEKKLVKEIFSIIEQNLPLEKAEMLKKKIAEHYN